MRVYGTRTLSQHDVTRIGTLKHVNMKIYSTDKNTKTQRLADRSPGYSDNTIRLWHAHTGELIGRPLVGHNGTVPSSSKVSYDIMYIIYLVIDVF